MSETSWLTELINYAIRSNYYLSKQNPKSAVWMAHFGMIHPVASRAFAWSSSRTADKFEGMVRSADNSSDFYIPDRIPAAEAYARCFHLAIGADQDHLEFRAFHGISSCYDEEALWFGGVI